MRTVYILTSSPFNLRLRCLNPQLELAKVELYN